MASRSLLLLLILQFAPLFSGDASAGDEVACEHTFRVWMGENGWERLDGTMDELETSPVGGLPMGKWSLGGTSSVIWLQRSAQLVLKHFVDPVPDLALERETKWLEYFSHQGEDIAPRLLATFTRGDPGSEGKCEVPSILMEYAGETLREENAPVDWERQIGEILQTLRVHNCSHNDLRPAHFLVGADGRIRIIGFGSASVGLALRSAESLFGPEEVSAYSLHDVAALQIIKACLGHRHAGQFQHYLHLNENLGTRQQHAVSSERHLFIHWNRSNEESLLLTRSFLASSELHVAHEIDMHAVPPHHWAATISYFYSPKMLGPISESEGRFKQPFTVFLVDDKSPMYALRNTTGGTRMVNTVMFDIKAAMRKNTIHIHGTENVAEALDNMYVLGLLGGAFDQVYSRFPRPFRPTLAEDTNSTFSEDHRQAIARLLGRPVDARGADEEEGKEAREREARGHEPAPAGEGVGHPTADGTGLRGPEEGDLCAKKAQRRSGYEHCSDVDPCGDYHPGVSIRLKKQSPSRFRRKVVAGSLGEGASAGSILTLRASVVGLLCRWQYHVRVEGPHFFWEKDFSISRHGEALEFEASFPTSQDCASTRPCNMVLVVSVYQNRSALLDLGFILKDGEDLLASTSRQWEWDALDAEEGERVRHATADEKQATEIAKSTLASALPDMNNCQNRNVDDADVKRISSHGGTVSAWSTFKISKFCNKTAALKLLNIPCATANSEMILGCERRVMATKMLASSGLGSRLLAHGNSWLATEWNPVGQFHAETTNHFAAIGSLLASLHRIDTKWFDGLRQQIIHRHPFLSAVAPGNYVWRLFLDDDLEYTVSQDSHADSVFHFTHWARDGWEDMLPALAESRSWSPRHPVAKRLVTTHGDFTPRHVVTAETSATDLERNRSVSALQVIDLDACHVNHAVRDLAFMSQHSGDLANKRAFLEGYLHAMCEDEDVCVWDASGVDSVETFLVDVELAKMEWLIMVDFSRDEEKYHVQILKSRLMLVSPGY